MSCTKTLFKGTAAAFLAATSAMAILSVTGTFIEDPKVFELDGNAVQDKGQGGDDWSNATGTASGLTHAVATSAPQAGGCSVPGWAFVVCDPTGSGDASEFTTGGSKDTLDVSNWKNTSTNVPDKDDITNAYAAAYSVAPSAGATPHTWIYFGADRFANNGDSNIGFWFFQNAISPGSGQGGGGTPFTGTPCPAGALNCAAGDLHRDGDIFIVSAFTNGGAVGTIQLYHWDHTKGGLVLDDDQNAAQCTPNAPSHTDVCADINTGDVKAPWPYTPKFGTAGVFPQGSFFEGGFDLTALAIKAGIPVPCFSTFLAETRSSQSTTAQLKDFVLGNFNLCGITVAGSCPAAPTVDGVNGIVHYSFSGTVSSTGASQLYDMKVTQTGTLPAGVTNLVLNQPNAAGAFSGTLDFNALGSFTVSFSACGATSPGGACSVTTDNTDPSNPKPAVVAIGFGNANTVCHPTIDASLSLTKSCVINLVPGASGVVLQLADTVTVCNTDATDSVKSINVNNNVTNVGATNPLDSGLTLTAGQCKTYTPKYTPTNCVNSVLNGANPDPGRCTFTDTASITGTPTTVFGTPVTVPPPAFATCTVCPNGVCAPAAAH